MGAQFQVWTEYIPDARSLEYMIFPRSLRACRGRVVWRPAPRSLRASRTSRRCGERIAAHLRRLDAAGIEYRPLAGPRPWQQGGTGPRRHRPGYLVEDVAVYLGQLAGGQGR